MAAGGWTIQDQKINKYTADFWVSVLPSIKYEPSFIIIPPTELIRRFWVIHGKAGKIIHTYLWITKTEHCWETRGLTKEDQELIVFDRFCNEFRYFSPFLNA